MIIKFLLWLGFVARKPGGGIVWPFKFAPAWVWRDWQHLRGWMKFHPAFYVFRNLPGVVKWVPGRVLPRRWGFGIYGLFEFGDRGH